MSDDQTAAPADDTAGSETDQTSAEASEDNKTLLGGEPSGESTTGEESKDESGNVSKDKSEDAGSEEGAPEQYADFTLPEGLELDKQFLDTAGPLMKDANLTQETAQKFVDLWAEKVQAEAKATSEAFTQQIANWAKEAKSDAEFGGDKFDENVGLARKAIAKLGGDSFKELLDSTGLGSHPEMIRFVLNAGKLIVEDDPEAASTAAGAAKDAASILYPKLTAKG